MQAAFSAKRMSTNKNGHEHSHIRGRERNLEELKTFSRQAAAREVIAQCEYDQNQKPNKARGDKHPREARAVAHVHEEEQHQQRFARRNRERDGKIQPTRVVERHVHGDEREQQQRDKNQYINFLRDNDVL